MRNKKSRPFLNETSRNFNEASQNLKKVLLYFQHIIDVLNQENITIPKTKTVVKMK